MKHFIRGHIYQLKKDNFFFACLALGVILLMISIRYFSPEPGFSTAMGSFMDTFSGGNILLYAFMLLTTNMVAEAYRSGVMKNIIGRGLSKKQFCLSIILIISVVYLLVMAISGIVMGVLTYNRLGMDKTFYFGYYALSIIARILFVMAHISFAVTMTILTRNAITGVVFALVIPNIPQILEMVFGFLKIQISLDFLKISAHMPSAYEASNNFSIFLPCFAVLLGYLIVSVFAGFRLLKYQDIK